MGIFNFSLELDVSGMVPQNFKRWFLLQNKPGLNLRAIRTAFVVMAYVLLIVIRPLNSKPGTSA